MAELYGSYGGYLLFTEGGRGVIINSATDMIEDAGELSEMLVLMPWSEDGATATEAQEELAANSLVTTSITTITASARLYTIPKGVQDEAKKALAWRKKHGRGGTPVGLNTARILAKGGQIGIRKVRHIAKYFPRHEVDKKGRGWSPGDDAFPSNGRIAWALWGGDAAWRWSRQIVERENKALRASGQCDELDLTQNSLDMFEAARAYEGLNNAPEFAARVRLDGTGIDRLYMIDHEGEVFVWDGDVWDDLGHVDSDIATYDRSLDEPYDLVDKHHILIDPASALVLAARFQVNPDAAVHVEDLDAEEASLVASAMDEIDWVVVDSTLVAAGEEPLSGDKDGYTPEERSANASRQVRDKTGRFAKTGSRVVIAGDPANSGQITKINPESGTVTVQMDNGNTVDVPGNLTQPAEDVPVTDSGGKASWKSRTPLDVSGILAQPRAPIDRPEAYISGGLPALRSQDVHQIINDFPGWVAQQRSMQMPTAPTAPSTLHPAGDYGTYEKSSYIKDLEQKTGTSLYTGSGYDHPLLQSFFSDPKNALYYQPITSAGAVTETAAPPKTKTAVTPTAKKASEPAGGTPLTPETSDVQPMYFALVSPDDPAAVMDLVSIVPATTKSTAPVTFKRSDGKWVRDDQILSDLMSATPPPVVALNGEVYQDVLSQVDATMTSSGAPTDLSTLFAYQQMLDIHPLAAGGGLDRNRGNAEKLRHYWLFGRGALKIRWNTPGDWTRCYRHLSKYMGPRAKGYCQLRHKEATGVYTGSKFNVGKRSIRGAGISDPVNLVDIDVVLKLSRLRAVRSSIRDRGLTAGAGGGAKFIIPLVIPEGVETGDGRIFKKGAIDTRNLPLPLLWQIKTGDGHDGSVVVGRIDHLERVDGGVGNAYGVFDTGPYGLEAQRMVQSGFLTGVSADLDKFEASEDEVDPGDDAEETEAAKKSTKKKKTDKKNTIKNSKIVVNKARVMAVTIVPKPAFQECKIFIDDPGVSADPAEDSPMQNIPDGVYVESPDALDAAAIVACGMVADAIPVNPPDEWFTDPKLSGPTPLTVDDNGRVYGHIAAWHVDHIGMTAGTRPPRSRSGYAYFHTGIVRSASGRDYPVGQLTLSGGHASLEASAVDAARHYDDTGSAVADVRAGEDAHGIWVSGALRPGTSPEQIRALRASAPSGDWRPIKGSLELVAVCQVNVPGFPIARARVASGQVYALVAAGAMTLAKMKQNPMTDLAQRIERIEERVGLSVLDQLKDMKTDKLELSTKAETLSAKIREGISYDELGYISTKKREELAKEGKALKDGSYPIRNVEELENAIQAYGRSKPGKRAAVRRHIMKRARSLKRLDLIPEKWSTAGLIDDDVVDSVRARAMTLQARLEAEAVLASAAGTVVPEEQELADALIAIAEKYGKFNNDDTGVWANYETAAENEKIDMGITCANCILYEGGTSCKIVDAEVEPNGYCRFALIPDGVVKKDV